VRTPPERYELVLPDGKPIGQVSPVGTWKTGVSDMTCKAQQHLPRCLVRLAGIKAPRADLMIDANPLHFTLGS
jgi:hypothetical protein